MTVKELFEKYCEKTEDGEYVVQGHCIKLCPATAEELQRFRDLCRGYLLRQDVCEEMAAFYAQTNSFLGYNKCDDGALFEWWKPKHHEVWLGNLDDMEFIYDDLEDVYGIRYSTETECFAKYKSLMEMLEAIVSDS